MKAKEWPLRLGDLLNGRRRSVFDLTPAIDRLNLELDHVDIVEEATEVTGRIFQIVTKAFIPGLRAERQLDGSFAPFLVVRFPTPVDDRDEWSRRCKGWKRPPSTIEVPDGEGGGTE
jgi:hypothetical protein